VTDGLADTSVFIARETGRSLLTSRLPDQLAVSVITIGELRAGVLVAATVELRNRRLATLTQALALEPLPIDESVAEAWANLRVQLRDLGRRMPLNDSWIAATAISLALPLVTRDDDYIPVTGLELIHV
jgi:predicted nucleic acid-binding protein